MSSRLKLAGVALLASFALAACGGGGGGTGSTPTGPTQAEQIAMLQGQIDALREQLGLGPDDVLSDSVSDLQEELAELRQQAKDRQDALDADAAKANSALAKALKAAIDIAKVAGDGTTAAVITPTMIPVLDADGEAGTDEGTEVDTVAITLKKGDAVGSLGNWKGTDYAGMEAPTGAAAKNTGMARMYSNQGAAKAITFASEAGAGVHGLTARTGAPVGDYDVPAGDNTNIGGFSTTGTTSYDAEDTVSGTFMKAPGTYTCIATGGCTMAATEAGVTVVDAQWTFTPAAGATLQQPDAQYLQFGWWVRKDKDGPTHAGVLYREVVPQVGTATLVTIVDSAPLVGKASYAGAAAGKFAISDPLRAGHDNAGHFTANAKLDADFKATGSTLSGMIDGFRLNDGSDDPGWSVELQKTGWDGTDKFATSATRDDDQTVWSINGAKGGASGAWEAQMFDENANDNSNVPTSVVGSFSSKIGSTHSMVGAFGAEKE